MKRECLRRKNKKGFLELSDSRLKRKNRKQKFALKKKRIRIVCGDTIKKIKVSKIKKIVYLCY